MSDSLPIAERVRILHTDGRDSVCLWLAVYDVAGRLIVYREHVSDAGPAEFAVQVVRETPDGEERQLRSFTGPEAWVAGGPAYQWRANGVAPLRAVDVAPDAGWETLRTYQEPVELLGRGGKWETAPRLRSLTQCERAARCLDAHTGWTLGADGKPAGDLLMARALLLACLSRPAHFTRPRDRAAEAAAREAAEEAWFGREFPRAAATERRRKRMGY